MPQTTLFADDEIAILPETTEPETTEDDTPTTYECDACGYDFDVDDEEFNSPHDAARMCEDCYNDHVYECAYTGNLYDDRCEERYCTHEGEVFSERAVTANIINQCPHYDTWHRVRDMYWVEGEDRYVSERAYDNYYGRCCSCDGIVSADEMTDDYCDSCYEDKDGGYIKCYSYDIDIAPKGGDPELVTVDKTDDWYHRTVDTNRYTGVELEVQCDTDLAENVHDLVSDFAILKEDSSIGGGFEIVSCPMTLDKHVELWELFFKDRPRGMESWTAGTCGMHVHMSRASLTELQIGKMLVFVNSDDNAKFVNRIAGRRSDKWEKVSPKKLTDIHSSDRYEAINLTNNATIEFRIFKGTLLKSSFFKNIEFCYALAEFCEDESYSEEQCADYKEFIKFALSRREQYPNLVEFIERRFSEDLVLILDSNGNDSLPDMDAHEDDIKAGRIAKWSPSTRRFGDRRDDHETKQGYANAEYQRRGSLIFKFKSFPSWYVRQTRRDILRNAMKARMNYGYQPYPVHNSGRTN